MKTRRTIYMVSFIVLISILVIFVLRWPWPSPSPGGPASEPTSLVLVRQKLTGEVLLRYVRGEQLQPFTGLQVGQQHLEQTLERAQDAASRSRGPGSANGQSALGRCAAAPAAMGSGLDGVEEPGVVSDGGG